MKNIERGGAGPGSRFVSELEAKVSKLRKELAETRIEKEILKNVYGRPCQGAAARYAMIEELRSRHKYKLGSMCSHSICHKAAIMLGNAEGQGPTFGIRSLASSFI